MRPASPPLPRGRGSKRGNVSTWAKVLASTLRPAPAGRARKAPPHPALSPATAGARDETRLSPALAGAREQARKCIDLGQGTGLDLAPRVAGKGSRKHPLTLPSPPLSRGRGMRPASPPLSRGRGMRPASPPLPRGRGMRPASPPLPRGRGSKRGSVSTCEPGEGPEVGATRASESSRRPLPPWRARYGRRRWRARGGRA